MMQRAPKRKKKRPNASDWRPSKRPKNDARTNTAKWRRNARKCDRTSETRSVTNPRISKMS